MDHARSGTPAGRYLRFLALAFAIVAALLAVGFLPTRRLVGDPGIPAMAAGCVISLVAAALAGGLLVASAARTPEARMQSAFLAMVVRLMVAVILGVAAAVSADLDRATLLFWLATAYVVLLPIEVRLAIQAE